MIILTRLVCYFSLSPSSPLLQPSLPLSLCLHPFLRVHHSYRHDLELCWPSSHAIRCCLYARWPLWSAPIGQSPGSCGRQERRWAISLHLPILSLPITLSYLTYSLYSEWHELIYLREGRRNEDSIDRRLSPAAEVMIRMYALCIFLQVLLLAFFIL
jgi:hypothetical protein